MTVQTDSGYVSIGEGDFIRTHRGITWAIKCRDLAGGNFVSVFVKTNGIWGQDGLAESLLDDQFHLRSMPVNEWFKTVLIPNLNKWLAKKFPPTGTTVPLSRFEQADQLINTALQIVVNPDGTLTAKEA